MSSAYSMPPCPYHLLRFTLQIITTRLSFPLLPSCILCHHISLAKFLTNDILNRKNKMPGTNVYLKSGCGSSQACALGSVMLRNKDMEWPEWRPLHRAGWGSQTERVSLAWVHPREYFQPQTRIKLEKGCGCHSQYHLGTSHQYLQPIQGQRGDPTSSGCLLLLRPQMSPPSTVPSLSMHHLHSKFLLSTLYTAVNKTNRNPVPVEAILQRERNNKYKQSKENVLESKRVLRRKNKEMWRRNGRCGRLILDRKAREGTLNMTWE